MSFDLASVLKNVPKLDTAQEQITYIELDRLEHDPNNFYELSDIDELAANIEFVGLQQPLRVRHSDQDADKYIIVSGHRRFAACSKLFAEGVKAYASLPCIIEQSAESEALRELRLIYANSDTRKMTSAELAKQAERVEMLLYQLKEEGVEFPGRMRDHVAEACNLSKSKLARLKVIRDKLIESFRPAYESGELSESAAYAIAQKPAFYQEYLKKYRLGKKSVGSLTEWDVKNFYLDVDKLESRHCPQADGPCSFDESIYNLYSKHPGYYLLCFDVCCSTCLSLAVCDHSCTKCTELKAQASAERNAIIAELEAENKARADALELRRRAEKMENHMFWLRLGEAADKAAVNMKEILEACGENVEFMSEAELAEYEDFLSGEVESPEDGLIELIDFDFDRIPVLADLLHVSIDYLFGRDGYDVQPACEFSAGKPPKSGRYLALFAIDGSSYEAIVDYESDIDRWSFPFGAAIESPCVAWYPLPDKF